jgi:type IV pilus assembly protein PilB
MSDSSSSHDAAGGKTQGSGSGQGSRLQVSSGDVADKFEKKMQQVSVKQKEKQTARHAAGGGHRYIDLEKFPVPQKALRLLDEDVARDSQVVCFFATEEEIRLGAVDPQSDVALGMQADIAKQTGANVDVYAISEKSLQRVLTLYKTLPTIKAVTKDLEIKAEDLEKVKDSINDFSDFQRLLEKTSITDLVTFVMGAGLKIGASDVHVEAEEGGIVVRFRLDGILHDAATISHDLYKKLISRLKLISSLKLNITNKPQDGRFSVKLPDGNVDVRVSTIPTVYGESVVMRLLVQRSDPYTLDGLGMTGHSLRVMQEEVKRPNGMIITTGPTGSGKTTTLYAMMNLLNNPGVKIITLEDPVEYKMEGINQSQIDSSKGYTFAKGLKSMLRQDPDIAMVGEIRELETAEIAIQASLTGHLILSTLHTNDAFGAIPRFLSMGVKPFLLAPALNAAIGQRLVRKLDDKTKVEATLSAAQEKKVDALLESLPEGVKKEIEGKPKVFYTAPKSETDSPVGYKGRVGIYEVIQMSKEIEENILSGNVSEYAIKDIAVAQGTVTMAQDGLLKALDGITSIEEVFRVIE